MQQRNTEQQQQQTYGSVPLLRQLPANTIKKTTSLTQQKYIDRNLPSPVKQYQPDPDDFDTERSLSTCPTYLSLSRQSRDTRECGTQITTITPSQPIEDDQDLLDNSLLPTDNNQVLLVDDIPIEEVELMPISSGFGYYPYNYPTTMTQRVTQPQIVSRAPQFRSNQNGYNGNSKVKSNNNLSPTRPTAVKQSPRSDTFIVPPKRNDTSFKGTKTNPAQNGSRQVPPTRKTPPPPPVDNKRSGSLRRNDSTRPIQKIRSPPTDQQDFGRKPVRFGTKHNNSYHPPTPPAYHPKPVPLPHDTSNSPRRIRVADNNYVIERRRDPPPVEYVYDDYHSDRTRPQRYVRVVREPSFEEEEDDDVYYVDRAPSRRRNVVRRSPRTEYIYVDEPPVQTRPRRSRRQEVVYVDEDEPEEEEEYIYVDEDGNEVDMKNKGKTSGQYVEYIYEDEKDKRRSHKPKIVYVDDDDHDRSKNPGRNKKKSKQSSSTRIVYE